MSLADWLGLPGAILSAYTLYRLARIYWQRHHRGG